MTSNAPDTSSNLTDRSPVCLFVDWCPTSEANRREHWSKRHKRATDAKGQWLAATRHDGQRLNGIRRHLLRALLSSPSAPAPSTTIISPADSNRSATLLRLLSESTMAIPASSGNAGR